MLREIKGCSAAECTAGVVTAAIAALGLVCWLSCVLRSRRLRQSSSRVPLAGEGGGGPVGGGGGEGGGEGGGGEGGGGEGGGLGGGGVQVQQLSEGYWKRQREALTPEVSPKYPKELSPAAWHDDDDRAAAASSPAGFRRRQSSGELATSVLVELAAATRSSSSCHAAGLSPGSPRSAGKRPGKGPHGWHVALEEEWIDECSEESGEDGGRRSSGQPPLPKTSGLWI